MRTSPQNQKKKRMGERSCFDEHHACHRHNSMAWRRKMSSASSSNSLLYRVACCLFPSEYFFGVSEVGMGASPSVRTFLDIMGSFVDICDPPAAPKRFSLDLCAVNGRAMLGDLLTYARVEAFENERPLFLQWKPPRNLSMVSYFSSLSCSAPNSDMVRPSSAGLLTRL